MGTKEPGQRTSRWPSPVPRRGGRFRLIRWSNGRDAEGGDTSGNGSGTGIGRSMTVVADTEGRRAGEEGSSPDGVEVK